MHDNILKIAAFADGDTGGNPAGVLISSALPTTLEMQNIAKEVGFSETAFAAKVGENWRVRYFSPESEVPFCGHATIALGAALAKKFGGGNFPLELNNAHISVSGQVVTTQNRESFQASLQSPPTHSKPAHAALVADALMIFGYVAQDLDPRIPPAYAHGGANHLVLALKDRAALATMDYDLAKGRALMNAHDLTTIAFVYAQSDTVFHARNAFASGGVLEDPATGAATAAFAGYLRDIHWPHQNTIEIIQGEDMGKRSLIWAALSDEIGSAITVSGHARIM